jgi:hypothetical protein
MLQRPGVNCAIFAGSFSFALNQSAIPEDPDVLRHYRLAASELLIKLVQVFVTIIQHLQNSDPYRVGNGSEQL